MIANVETLQLINSLQTSPVKGQQEIKHYVNLVVGLDQEGVLKLSARPDVISITRYSEPVKLDERQDFVLVGNLTGNAPTPGDYLTYLAGKGFTSGPIRRVELRRRYFGQRRRQCQYC
jgi:hypothetical protein